MSVFTSLARLRRALTAPVPLLGLVAAVGPLAMSPASTGDPVSPAEAAYLGMPALPAGSTTGGREGVEATAIELATTLGAVTLDHDDTPCPVERLQVSWVEPGPGYAIGAYVGPIGPAPTDDTTDVNGIVVCDGSTFAYMGFEARWRAARWDVIAVPDVADESEEHLTVQPAPSIPQGPKPVPVLAAPGTVTGPIEGYAAYEPQRTCDATVKVGTRSLAGALLRDYPGSRNLGILRGCSVGGRSEHKEYRAFDWGVNITNPNEKAATDAFIGALMATDAAGNKHALARRMGLMYVITDRKIWSSYRHLEGWRPYSGASAHRDHVHISLSWAGAEGRTSFWSGTVPPDLPVATAVTSNVSSRTRSGGTSATAGTGRGGHRRGAGDPVAAAPRASDEHRDDGGARDEWRRRREERRREWRERQRDRGDDHESEEVARAPRTTLPAVDDVHDRDWEPDDDDRDRWRERRDRRGRRDDDRDWSTTTTAPPRTTTTTAPPRTTTTSTTVPVTAPPTTVPPSTVPPTTAPPTTEPPATVAPPDSGGASVTTAPEPRRERGGGGGRGRGRRGG